MADIVLCQPQCLSSAFERKVFQDQISVDDISCLGQSDIENTFFRSLVHVLKVYGMHAQEKMELSDAVYVSGGLQQYLIRTRKKEENSIQQPRKGCGSYVSTFHDLPVGKCLTECLLSSRLYCLWSDVRRPPMSAGHIILQLFAWKTTNIFIYYQQIYHF